MADGDCDGCCSADSWVYYSGEGEFFNAELGDFPILDPIKPVMPRRTEAPRYKDMTRSQRRAFQEKCGTRTPRRRRARSPRKTKKEPHKRDEGTNHRSEVSAPPGLEIKAPPGLEHIIDISHAGTPNVVTAVVPARQDVATKPEPESEHRRAVEQSAQGGTLSLATQPEPDQRPLPNHAHQPEPESEEAPSARQTNDSSIHSRAKSVPSRQERVVRWEQHGSLWWRKDNLELPAVVAVNDSGGSSSHHRPLSEGASIGGPSAISTVSSQGGPSTATPLTTTQTLVSMSASQQALEVRKIVANPEEAPRVKKIAANRSRSISQPSRFLYRCMRGDRRDYDPPADDDYYPQVPENPMILCQAVVWCISKGSTFTSCFLHFTKDIEVAAEWRDKGRRQRNDHNNYLVRLDVNEIDPQKVIDVSTERELKHWLHRTSNGQAMEDEDIQEAIHSDCSAARRLAHGEVLIKARGDFPYAKLQRCNSRGARVH